MKQKIFILEDSEAFADALIYKLKSEVVWAKTYHEAEKILKKDNNDYLLAYVDFRLPDEPDGKSIDLVLEHNIPVVVMTGDLSDETQEIIRDKKVVDYVMKEGPHVLNYLAGLADKMLKNKTTKVLAVAGTKRTREDIRDILSIQRYIILEASSGEEALFILDREDGIKVALIDYRMPFMDTFELITRIREKYTYDKLAIIVISGEEDNKLSVKFMKYGANDFLIRPFLNEHFYVRISQNIRIINDFETIRKLSYTDSLTGLYNRRYFLEVTSNFYNNAKRTKEAFVIVMADIDYFKNVNDAYGHHIGDEVLRKVSATMKESFRKSDIISRFGGEEFCMLLNNIKKKDVYTALENFRKKIESLVFHADDNEFHISVSIGVCSELENSLDNMIKDADKKMYRAKRLGRNQIVVDMN